MIYKQIKLVSFADMFFTYFRRASTSNSVPLATFYDSPTVGNSGHLISRPRRKIYFTVLLLSFVSIILVLVFALYHSSQHQQLMALEHHFLYPPVLGPDPKALYLPATPNFYLPEMAHYNIPPPDRPRTPIFIGFTRNIFML
jgi:hypothetical protein